MLPYALGNVGWALAATQWCNRDLQAARLLLPLPRAGSDPGSAAFCLLLNQDLRCR